MALTQQQSDPHPRLVHCRNAIQAALSDGTGTNFRMIAAEICNHLTHDLVDAVLAVAGDAEKVKQVIQPAKEVAKEKPAPEPVEEPAPRRSKK